MKEHVVVWDSVHDGLAWFADEDSVGTDKHLVQRKVGHGWPFVDEFVDIKSRGYVLNHFMELLHC